jgi:hypothetical protein
MGSEKDNMLSGERYDPLDPQLAAERDSWSSWRTPWPRDCIS